MAGVNKYKDGVVARLFKGLHRPDQGPRDHRRSRATGRLVGPRDRRGRRHVATPAAQSCSPPAPTPARCPASSSTASGCITSEHALQLDRVPASVVVLGGGVIGCEFASVWRSLRRRGHDHRGAAPAGARRGRGSLEGARAGLPQAQHRASRPARRSSRRAHRHRRARDRRGRRHHRGRPAAGRGRPRPATDGPRLRGAGHRDGARLRAHRRAAAAPTSRASTPSATSCPACSSRTAGSSRASSSPRRSPGSTPPPIDEAGIPRVTYCDPEVASVGLTEAQAARATYGDDAVETLTYDLGGNGKSQILKTQGFVKLVRRKDGPVVGVHMVGARVGELDRRGPADLQLGGLPRGRRPARARAPDPERGPRRGPPRAGRQTAARPLLTLLHPRL